MLGGCSAQKRTQKFVVNNLASESSLFIMDGIDHGGLGIFDTTILNSQQTRSV